MDGVEDNLSRNELRALSFQDLQNRIKRLQTALLLANLTSPARQLLMANLTAAELALEAKTSNIKALEGYDGNRKASEKVYAGMNREQLMDAYDYYAAKQRSLAEGFFERLLIKKDWAQDWSDDQFTEDENFPDDDEMKFHKTALSELRVNGLYEVFNSIEKISLSAPKKGGPRYLQDAVTEYGRELGPL